MPATLRRRNRQELTLRKSFVEAMRDKLSSSIFRRPSDKSSPRPPESRRREYSPSYNPDHRARSIQRSAVALYSSPHSIRYLPPELLAYIFILGSEDDPLLPVSVSHVCRFWRELAIHTASLWRRVVLGCYYNMWRETIHRARACTLDIELSSRIRPGIPAFYEVQRYMHLVMPHIKRWRSLRIVFTGYQPYLWNAALSECCMRSSQTQVPELEELCLVYRHNDDTKEFCLFSGRAPRLRRLVIDGIRLTWLPSLFENLTHLDYTHHGLTSGCHAIQELSNLLRVSSRLVKLGILFPYKKHRSRPASLDSYCASPTTLYLPWVKTLLLRVETRDIPEELIVLASLFNTPRLAKLQLVDTRGQQFPFRNIHHFWKHYPIPPSVRALYLHDGWYQKEAVTFITQLGTLQWLVFGYGQTETAHRLH
ncbi:hypothetical protein GYMLUDRAFT_34062 [Collybiopsis luxurians FD-317 M1]|nr:hypothetical protein GYMLUDRAFT_34062 [Collybiopsis luxurians FD-317 M1]